MGGKSGEQDLPKGPEQPEKPGEKVTQKAEDRLGQYVADVLKEGMHTVDAFKKLSDTVGKIPFEQKSPEIVDSGKDGKKIALPIKDDWEVKPHNKTETKDNTLHPGKVFRVDFPAHEGQPGGSRTIDRDKEGKVTKVTEPDGSSYEKGGDGKWHRNPKAGARELDPREYNVSADDKGNVKIEDKTNNTSREEYADGHSVERDSKGRVTEVDYLNKDPNDLKSGGDGKRHYKHDDQGNITEYTAPNGSHWKKDGDHWQKLGKDGQPQKPTDDNKNVMYGDMSVDAAGNLTIKNHHMKGQEAHSTTVSADGKRVETKEFETAKPVDEKEKPKGEPAGSEAGKVGQAVADSTKDMHLKPEEVKAVQASVEAAMKTDKEALQNFLKHASPAEEEAMIKSLKVLGYKVDVKEGPLTLGGPVTKEITITGSDPKKVMHIREKSNPATGSMDIGVEIT